MSYNYQRAARLSGVPAGNNWRNNPPNRQQNRSPNRQPTGRQYRGPNQEQSRPPNRVQSRDQNKAQGKEQNRGQWREQTSILIKKPNIKENEEKVNKLYTTLKMYQQRAPRKEKPSGIRAVYYDDEDEEKIGKNGNVIQPPGKHLYFRAMFSLWMNKVPHDLAENWTVKMCPKGKRVIVVAHKNRTTFYSKKGKEEKNFTSALPGGSFAENCQRYTVLDCILDESTSIFYALDVIAWNCVSLTRTSAAARFFLLASKFIETPELNNEKNEFKFVLLPQMQALPDVLEKILAEPYKFDKTEVELDGLLFYKLEGTYIRKMSSDVLWLKTFSIPEVFNIKINDVYMIDKPEDYRNWKHYTYRQINLQKGKNGKPSGGKYGQQRHSSEDRYTQNYGNWVPYTNKPQENVEGETYVEMPSDYEVKVSSDNKYSVEEKYHPTPEQSQHYKYNIQEQYEYENVSNNNEHAYSQQYYVQEVPNTQEGYTEPEIAYYSNYYYPYGNLDYNPSYYNYFQPYVPTYYPQSHFVPSQYPYNPPIYTYPSSTSESQSQQPQRPASQQTNHSSNKSKNRYSFARLREQQDLQQQ